MKVDPDDVVIFCCIGMALSVLASVVLFALGVM